MAKNINISQTITKILLSASIFQLMLICFVLMPPTDCFSLQTVSLRSYIPEMIEYAVLTLTLSIPIGVIAEKILKK